MPLDFRNVNTLWSSVIAQTLTCVGLETVVICPGSRSAPLTVAFAQHPTLRAISVLDERSASFFALGVARRTHRPVVLVCTSGTAGANFYPAVIEARESRVPLLILTADRPPELRHCNAGQAIDQQKLYGTYPNWQTELAMPEVELLAYVRQTLIYAWEQTLYPIAGPVHVNVPLREPLAPIEQPEITAIADTFPQTTFFSQVRPPVQIDPTLTASDLLKAGFPLGAERGVIIAGPAQPRSPQRYAHAIATIAQRLGYPVFAEGLSPLRNYGEINPHLISTYDGILRNAAIRKALRPDVVVRIGDMPTSKVVRTWLEEMQSPQWILDPDGRNLDPLHGPTNHLRGTVESLAEALCMIESPLSDRTATYWNYLKVWRSLEAQASTAIASIMQATPALIESKVAWLMSQILPATTPIFISNSMPVRDVEWFWSRNSSHVQPYFNRGANGIDGSLSTALGIAQGSAGVMLTGDLALLHDSNGWLLRSQWHGHLTVVLINNNGGGIFEMLPIAQFEPPFEKFFATPQAIDFAQLCAAYGVEHESITSWDQLRDRLQSLPSQGLRVLEIATDRKRDAHWRKQVFDTITQVLVIQS